MNIDVDDLIDTPESLEKTYHNLIPISAHMGVKVVSWDGQKLVLQAPLANNINHQQSAFGGSLFSLAALAGWGLLQLKLAELELHCNTVIAGGDVNYAVPVFDDFTCECALPKHWPEVVTRLTTKGKGSLDLPSIIMANGKQAMAFNGRYVIVRKSKEAL
ncbi:MAG: YiiD C-terminal domain-containing protein [Pseudomonadales bacterium]